MNTVGIVGCSLMGAGIAEVCARSGLDVVIVESSYDAAKAGLDRLRTSLERAEVRGQLASANDVLNRIEVVTDFDALADRGDRRGRGSKDRRRPPPRQDRAFPERDPRVRYLVDPNHEALDQYAHLNSLAGPTYATGDNGGSD